MRRTHYYIILLCTNYIINYFTICNDKTIRDTHKIYEITIKGHFNVIRLSPNIKITLT